MKRLEGGGVAAIRLAVAVWLAVLTMVGNPSPAAAEGIGDYFAYGFRVTFSKTEVARGEVFSATATANASAARDMPVNINAASFTGRVVAIQQPGGTRIVLNPSYNVTLTPFPNKKGEKAEVSTAIQLQFPETSQPGSYQVVGELIKAEIQAGPLWLPVPSGLLPQSQNLGLVTLMSATTQPPPVAPPQTTPVPTPPSARPAAFTISALTVSPSPVRPGDEVTIRAMVTNVGDTQGTFIVQVLVNDTPFKSSSVTLAGGAGQSVSFTGSWLSEGTYSVKIGNLAASFMVARSATTPPPTRPATTTPSAAATPPGTTPAPVTASPTVTLPPGKTTSTASPTSAISPTAAAPTPTTPPSPEVPNLDRWLMMGVFGAGVLLVVFVLLIVRQTMGK